MVNWRLIQIKVATIDNRQQVNYFDEIKLRVAKLK